MTVEDEVRTFQLGLETTRNGVTIEAPWVQRQANGAVIVRLHLRSEQHQAGELLLNDTDVTALDPDERPLRTQVRRVWGYATLADVTPAHMETARFDVGFRLDLASSRGFCGLAIALLRSFNPIEGPRVIGGPWVFKFRVADDAEIAEALQAEAARQQAAREEAARQEAARQEALRLDAERREAQFDEQSAESGAVRGETQRPERRSGERLPRRDWEAERERAAQLRAEAEAHAAAGTAEPHGARAHRDSRPAPFGEGDATAASNAPLGEAGVPSAESLAAREGRGPRRRGGRFLRPEQAAADRDDEAAIAASVAANASALLEPRAEAQAAPPERAQRPGRRPASRRSTAVPDETASTLAPAAPAQQPAVRPRRTRAKPSGDAALEPE